MWFEFNITSILFILLVSHISLLQLVDDALDFVASDQEMGKPTAADLSLGLATAPVLFASEEVCVLEGYV